jgi:hypothetical protein
LHDTGAHAVVGAAGAAFCFITLPVKPLCAIWAGEQRVQKEPEQIYSGDIVFLRHIWCRCVRREFIQMTGAITEKAGAMHYTHTHNFHLANGVRRAAQQADARHAKSENVCGLRATLCAL